MRNRASRTTGVAAFMVAWRSVFGGQLSVPNWLSLSDNSLRPARCRSDIFDTTHNQITVSSFETLSMAVIRSTRPPSTNCHSGDIAASADSYLQLYQPVLRCANFHRQPSAARRRPEIPCGPTV